MKLIGWKTKVILVKGLEIKLLENVISLLIFRLTCVDCRKTLSSTNQHRLPILILNCISTLSFSVTLG